ncbi:MAG: hypothetical protein LAT82_00475 [Nanoarchaeota archaeon]|nr:hypothetical protein [Nanoarchaeota archaeon]
MKQKSNLISKLGIPIALVAGGIGVSSYLIKNDPIGRNVDIIQTARSLDDFGGYVRFIPNGELQPLRRSQPIDNYTQQGVIEAPIKECVYDFSTNLENFNPSQIQDLDDFQYGVCIERIVEEGKRQNFP